MAALKNKKAGLTVMISDACGEVPAFGRGLGQTAGRVLEWPLFDLIFKTKGVVNVNAAPIGESAYYLISQSPSVSERGGIFTRAFVHTAVYGDPIDVARLGSDEAWNLFFRRVGDISVEQGRNALAKQPRPCKITDDGRSQGSY